MIKNSFCINITSVVSFLKITLLVLLLMSNINNNNKNTASAQTTCYQQNATPVTLEANGGSFGPCPAGYYCPGVAANSSYVYICPPTDDCLNLRLLKKSFCDLQGPSDVAICAGGYFCPAYNKRQVCPEGYFCPVGSTAPRECSPLSYCPAGSYREVFYGVFLVYFFMIFCVVIVLHLVYTNVGVVPSSWTEDEEQAMEDHAPNNEENNNNKSNQKTPQSSKAITPKHLQNVWGGSSNFVASPSFNNAMMGDNSPSADFDTDLSLRVIGEAIKRRRTTAQENTRKGRKSRKNRGQERLSIEFQDISVSVPVSSEEIKQKHLDDEKEKKHRDASDENNIDNTIQEDGSPVAPEQVVSKEGSLSFTLPNKKRNNTDKNPASYNEKGEKILLHPMSGTIESGKITAILGASGAGKSVFMTRLLGRKEPGWSTNGIVRTTTTFNEEIDDDDDENGANEKESIGDDNGEKKKNGDGNLKGILKNRKPVASAGSTTVASRPLSDEEFRDLVAYVPQDDVLHYELTVHANVYFASETRLPASWTSEEKEAFRRAVLNGLQLLPHADRRVGAPGDQDESGQGGLSGGQRKRCSVAVELASAPIFLCCDEATSALDASVAQKLCALLKRLCQEADIPILMILHQPRIEIWEMIDNLFLLAPGGHQAYAGPREDVIDFLKEYPAKEVDYAAEGIDFEVGNPADIAIDFISKFPTQVVDAWKKHANDFKKSLIQRKIRRALKAGGVTEQESENMEKQNGTKLFEEENEVVTSNPLSKKPSNNDDPHADVVIEESDNDNGDNDQDDDPRYEHRSITSNNIGDGDDEDGHEIPHGKMHTEQALQPMQVENLEVVKIHQEKIKLEKQNQEKQQQHDHTTEDDAPIITVEPHILDNSRISLLHEAYILFLRRLLIFATDWKVLVNDVIMTLIVSAIVSASVVDGKWGSPLKGQYVLLGPKFQSELPFMYGMMAGIGAASAVGAASIRVWGLEKPQLFRSFRSGNRVSAVFIGYSAAEILRLLLLSFSFALVGYLMWRPVMQFGDFFGIMFGYFLLQDAAGSWIGIFVPTSSARLIALIVTVFLSLLNGFPDVPLIHKGFFSYWFTNLMAAAELEPSQHVYDYAALTSNDAFGNYVNDPFYYKPLAIGVLVLWFIVLKGGAFLHLLYLSRK